MRRWYIGFLLPLLLCAARPAHAQDPGKIFDFLQNQIQNEIARKQQRKFERQQQHINKQLFDAFLAAWNDCFSNNSVPRCDEALSYPYLNETDRQQLVDKRGGIVAEEQGRLAGEEIQRQLERERAAAAERARQEEIEQQRQRDADRERADAERARLAREAEQQRLAEVNRFESALSGCRRFILQQCDAAVVSPHATPRTRRSSRRSAVQHSDMAATRRIVRAVKEQPATMHSPRPHLIKRTALRSRRGGAKRHQSTRRWSR